MNCLRSFSFVSLALLAAPFAVHAQGTLTPAGAPAPMMKTLAQLEARVDVSTLPGDATAVRVISQPGSYYLTADVVGALGKDGIRIVADDVTLDLNGFAVRGVFGAMAGIRTPAGADGDNSFWGRIVIRNGVIANWPQQGIFAGGVGGVEVSDVRVAGCSLGGISINGGASRVERCTVQSVGTFGIRVLADERQAIVVTHCSVMGVTGLGNVRGILVAGGLVEHCAVSDVSGVGSIGIYFSNGVGRVAHCDVMSVYSNGAGSPSVGINAPAIEQCTISAITAGGTTHAYGIYAMYPMTITGCRISGISGYSAIGINGNDAADVTGGVGAVMLQSSEIMNVTAATNAFGVYRARAVLDCVIAAIDGPTPASSIATGIQLSDGGTASRCSVRSTEGVGIHSGNYSTVIDCSVDRAGTDGTGEGIAAVGGCRIERNRISNSPVGINQTATSLVLGNLAISNTVNFSGVPAALIVSTYASVAAGSSNLNFSF